VIRVLHSAVLLIVIFAGSASAQTPHFLFTAISDQDEERLVTRFNRFAKYLEGKLGVPVIYVPVPSYSAAVWAFKSDYVQLAWFGGVTGFQARRAVPGSEAIAQGAEDVNFKSYFIANAGAGLKPAKEFPAAIAVKTFAFGSRVSTSGCVMPEYFIRKHLGKGADNVFSRVGYSGNHSRTLELVQSGAYQLGALDYTVYEVEKKAGKVDTSKVSVIWETPSFPDYQFTIRGDVEKTFAPVSRRR
jgi:phosphonate transport system substrate-binding protein